MRFSALAIVFVLACSPIGALAQQTSPPTQQPSSPAPGADASNAKSSVQIDSKSLVGSTVRREDGKDVWNDVKVGRDRAKFVVTLLQSALPTTESPTKTR